MEAARLIWTVCKGPMLELAFEQLRGDLREAFEATRGFQSFELFIRKIQEDKFCLWVVVDGNTLELLGGLVTELIQFPLARILHVHLCTGKELDSWISFASDMLEALAAVNGANEVTICGRAGWQKKLKPHGFDFGHVMLRRPVGTRH